MSNMSTQENMDRLVEQLTRIADALEKYNDFTVEFEKRMVREQEAEERRQRDHEERILQGLPADGPLH